jgi:23S rRNA (cytosine1962-C5)-methyltransferase
MREMRGRVRSWAAGRRVLNTFAYTCGFGVAAHAGGAARVANLDVSWPLLERGRANYRANGLRPEPDDFLYGDTFDWLPRLKAHHELFDMVILDPPGFARTKTHTFSAARDYGTLAAAAAGVIAPDGLLVACCNVADLSWERFEDRVVAGLDDAWRASEIVGRFGAPVLDFPALPGHESYLKILVARLA